MSDAEGVELSLGVERSGLFWFQNGYQHTNKHADFKLYVTRAFSFSSEDPSEEKEAVVGSYNYP